MLYVIIVCMFFKCYWRVDTNIESCVWKVDSHGDNSEKLWREGWRRKYGKYGVDCC